MDHPEFIAMTRDLDLIIYVTPEDDRTIWIDANNILAIEQANRPAAA